MGTPWLDVRNYLICQEFIPCVSRLKPSIYEL
jgi:hypothetical protein